MIALALALMALACPDLCVGGARPFCCARREAYDQNDYDRVFELIEQEVAAAQAERAEGSGPIALDSLRPLCSPLEVGFNTCNEWRPERRCAARYLAQYAAVGCLDDPAQVARYFNMQAMHAARRLDYAEALDHARRAEEQARTIWQARSEGATGTRALLGVAASLGTRAHIAAQLHRHEAVRSIVAELERTLAPIVAPERAGAVADSRNVVAWALLLAREAEGQGQDPTPLLEQALDTFTRVRPNRDKADNVRINLALAALQDGALTRVRDWLAPIDATTLNEEGRMWLRLVQVRAALLAGGAPEVESWLADLEQIGRGNSTPMGGWFAAWTRGLRHDAAGAADAAIAAYEQAEVLLESYAHARGSLDVALADRHYLTYAASSRRLAQLQAESGAGDAAERAVWTARHARSRALRMAARASCDDAQFVRHDGPAAGELRLLYFRLGPQDRASGETLWFAAAITRRGTRSAMLKLPTVSDALAAADEQELERWSDRLLAPFFAEIDESGAIEILATESLHEVPFHALPWEAGILLDRATVRYGTDVETCRLDAGFGGGALVLRGDDAYFAAETKAVAAALGERWEVTVDAPRGAADLASLFAGTHRVAHVVSHGRRGDLDRFFDSDDRLQFTAELALSRRELLAMVQAPALVSLSACKSSFVDAESLGGSVSLAHAFILRGAHHVAGSVDDIDGELASAFAGRFHQGIAAAGLGDVPEVWREAYLATADATASPSLSRQLRSLRLYAR